MGNSVGASPDKRDGNLFTSLPEAQRTFFYIADKTHKGQMQRSDRLHKRISAVAVRRSLQVRNSRDFDVRFWVIAAIDIFNFQPNFGVTRVPL